MALDSQSISDSLTAPQGFRAAGVWCGIKAFDPERNPDENPPLDLSLIVSDRPGPVAGVFTANQIMAAPVKWCQERIRNGTGQAIVVNSGNANACTGPQGVTDTQAMAEATAQALGIAKTEHVLVASTGRIGHPLPMTKIHHGIAQAAESIKNGTGQSHDAAQAIMTSDTFPKAYASEIPWSTGPIRLGGIAKGAGMIAPQMVPPPAAEPHATMLAFLTTDAVITQSALQSALEQAVRHSFNGINVDGDMSTNDSVIVLANGQAANPPIDATDSPLFPKFCRALTQLCEKLAKDIVLDGEGATRQINLRLSGARNDEEAEIAVRAVANSVLVKTSWTGGNPNWGRILAALGYSSAKVVEEKIDLAYSAPDSAVRVYSLRQGRPVHTPFEELCSVVGLKTFDLHIDLNLGPGQARLFTCDLSEEYVRFNMGDISNPENLGG